MITKQFLTAGEAIFTASSAKTNSHYTYRVQRPKDFNPESPVWFIGVLTGPSNTEDYDYLGLLNASGEVKITRASFFKYADQCVKVCQWAVTQVWKGVEVLPEGYKIEHCGRCGRCGRLLTTEKSIYDGFGPECVKLV